MLAEEEALLRCDRQRLEAAAVQQQSQAFDDSRVAVAAELLDTVDVAGDVAVEVVVQQIQDDSELEPTWVVAAEERHVKGVVDPAEEVVDVAVAAVVVDEEVEPQTYRWIDGEVVAEEDEDNQT